MKQIKIAIILECLFAEWCGDNYALFSADGCFPGLGTPREIFIAAIENRRVH